MYTYCFIDERTTNFQTKSFTFLIDQPLELQHDNDNFPPSNYNNIDKREKIRSYTFVFGFNVVLSLIIFKYGVFPNFLLVAVY